VYHGLFHAQTVVGSPFEKHGEKANSLSVGVGAALEDPSKGFVLGGDGGDKGSGCLVGGEGLELSLGGVGETADELDKHV